MSENTTEAVNRTDIRPWQDPETLQWAYSKCGERCSPVADLLGCGRRTVNRWMDRHDLYPDSPDWQDESVLRELYVEQGLSQKAIGDKFDESPDVISDWLMKLGVTNHECPTCGDMLPSYRGVKIHHANVHGESISGETTQCAWCGSDFSRRRYATTGIRFCDNECRGNWMSDTLTGENHHNWIGGVRRDYGPGWDDKKKASVRDRDNNQCADCGMSNEEHIKQYQCQLHVHHITPARSFDDPKERNSMDNLVTLCCECHQNKWEKIPGLRPDTA